MEAEAFELIENDGRIEGVRYRRPDGGVEEVRALLTVAADGRHSAIRRVAGLTVVDFGAPMDVLWFRISRQDTDPSGPFLRAAPGRLIAMLDRRTYWQAGYVIAKGGLESLKAAGIQALHAELRRYLPFLGDRVTELGDWGDAGFLEVRVDRLERWYRPGLLCIGDAAHAMSPVGGVGINLALQDAVAAANLLAEPLGGGEVTEADLARVQRRRALPTRLTQRLQLFLQRNLVGAVLSARSAQLPWAMRIGPRLPFLRRLIPRFLAIGVRNEHVRTEAVGDSVVG
jgi:2-polyprenyl-6-methoxyphenol hydroxylase-like FAD-dependent oxidoreductase